MAKATARAASVEIVRTGLGRSRHGRPRVRIINTTSVCVAMDSTNQPVRTTCSEPKEERAESYQVENRRRWAYHPGEPHDILHPPALRAGRAMSVARTLSKGMPISETS